MIIFWRFLRGGFLEVFGFVFWNFGGGIFGDFGDFGGGVFGYLRILSLLTFILYEIEH